MKEKKEIQKSAVDFKGAMRMHVALHVSDMKKSTAFYTAVFNEPPIKERKGYAKFEPGEPSVNFTLNQSREPISGPGGLSHLGIQLTDTGQLEAITSRMRDLGLIELEEMNTSCCYALQDKIWLKDPDGNSLEFFVVLDPDTYDPEDPMIKNACCVPEETTAQSSCCAEPEEVTVKSACCPGTSAT